MNTFFRFTLPLVFILLSLSVASQNKVTFCSLLGEMTDMERLTRLSEQEYRSVQFSSYDRRSVSPYKDGWFANSDGFGKEPVPGFEKVLKEPGEDGIGEYLICDVKQPGAILRLWSARINGSIRLYIDNADVPYFEGKAEDFFWQTPKVLTGKKFSEEAFRQFDAVYFPIPFAKRLRIEWIGDIRKLHFYHVGMRLYDKNTKVESFSKKQVDACGTKPEAVIARLQQKDIPNLMPKENNQFVIPARNSRVVWKTEGMAAIESIWLKTDVLNAEKMLRKCILNIYFDDSSVPQVQAPLGDFFGAAPGVNPFKSVPFSVSSDGFMVSRFVMPFINSARIEVDNRSDFDFKMLLEVKTTDYNWEDGKSMHFRARWRINHDLIASNTNIVDMNYLMATGKGRFVGAATYVYNPSNVPTPWGNWWGEGDEKIFIDNEKFPAFFGTGSEDYYNYSWSSTRIFYYPYCGQPRNDGPGNRGYASNFRWNILDDIPFTTNFAFYMELFPHEVVTNVSYGRIAYYYALPGTIDNYSRITEGDIRDLPYDRWSPVAVKGSVGFRFVNAEDMMEKNRNIEVEDGKLWAEGQIMMWKPERDGEQLTLSFHLDKPIPENRIGFTLAKMPEGGSISVWVNGKQVKINDEDQVYLIQEFQTVLDNFFTEPVQLPEGENEIVLVNRSDNPSAKIGLDFIWIKDE